MRVHIQNSISIASAIFAELTIMTDRQTDRPHYSVHSNRPHLANAVMGPKTDMTAVTPRVVNRQIKTWWPSVPKNACIKVTIQYKDSHARRDKKKTVENSTHTHEKKWLRLWSETLMTTRDGRARSESMLLSEMIFEVFLVIVRQLTKWATKPFVFGLPRSPWQPSMNRIQRRWFMLNCRLQCRWYGTRLYGL